MRIFEMRLDEIEQNQSYATTAQLKELAEYMQSQIPGSKFSAKGKSRGKEIPHIRVHNATKREIKDIADSIGLIQQEIDDKQSGLSTQFKQNIYGFADRLGTLYSLVISTRGASEESTGIAKKALTPTGLGLDGQKMKRDELIRKTKSALKEKIRDPRLLDILNKLVTIAASNGDGRLSSEDMAYIEDSRNVISTDFGEILAPIMIMREDDMVDFPVGNNPIVDVYIETPDGRRSGYAIKSLSGSGNSFAAISDLMDNYEKKLKEGTRERALYEIIKIFKQGSPGTVKDKIIRAALHANTPEAQAMKKIVGNFSDFDSLSSAIQRKLGNYFGDYVSFLRLVYPASIAGNWGRPYGMPADSNFYMSGGQGRPPQDTQAGKKSYDRDPLGGGGDIATYILGQSLLQMATKGEDATVYNRMMTDIVSSANVQLGKIDLNKNGELQVFETPFSGIKFRFDYHAPSHKPGNNSPGFIMAKE